VRKKIGMMPAVLDAASTRRGLAELAERDADLGRVLVELGPPPMWDRPPGFPTLVQIILEQQVSLASARACYDKLRVLVGELTPKSLLALTDDELRAIGFSRQKSRYVRILAELLLSGELDLDQLNELPDDEARERLMAVTGIGRWTADIYLLMALLRADIWPVGDLALLDAAHRVKGLVARPTAEEFHELGEAWRPWRSLAARLLWHFYLSDER
jgi:DNA-3-methyladenine glycosylase II